MILVSPDQSRLIAASRTFGSDTRPGIWVHDIKVDQTSIVDYPGEYPGSLVDLGEHFAVSSTNRERAEFSITIASKMAPSSALATLRWCEGRTEFSGERDLFSSLPTSLLTHFWASDSVKINLFRLDLTRLELHPIYLNWFYESPNEFDPGYQGIFQIGNHPASGNLLVSLHKSGSVYICDPHSGTRLSKLDLPNVVSGNAAFVFGPENRMCISSYSNLFQFDENLHWSHQVGLGLHSRGGPGAPVVDTERQVILVSRFKRGDILCFDLETLKPVKQYEIGGQPYEIAIAGDQIFARQWDLDDLLRVAL